MSVFKRLLPYIKGQQKYYILGLISLLITDLCVAINPWLIKNGIDSLAKPNSKSYLLTVSIFIILTGIITAVFRYGWRKFIINAARRIEYELRNDYFKHLTKLHLSYFQKMNTGDLMSRAINDLNAVRELLALVAIIGFDIILMAAFSLFMMLKIDPILTLYILIVMPGAFVAHHFAAKMIHKRYERVQQHLSSMSTFVQENFSGIKVVQAYAQQEYENKKFQELCREYLNRNMKLANVTSAFTPSIHFFMSCGLAIVLAKGGERVILDVISLGEFVAFNTYLLNFTWPVVGMSMVINLYQRGKTSMARLNEIFDVEPRIVSSKNEIKKMEGKIQFKNLNFSYESSSFSLKNISFDINKGNTVAIMGLTGSGKTTLVNLIPRLFEIKEGMLFIDGVDINKIPLDCLRRSIGFVSQEPFLFSDTIKANIAFGTPNASLEDIHEAAKLAQLTATIESFPEKYDTIIGERGVTLSGGQKQRVAIARALLTKPSILILDDAFSSVDTETEEAIVSKLFPKTKNITCIFISHRISTARHASKIVVLDKGNLVELGTHEFLMARKGVYAHIAKLQKLEDSLKT